jgi:hypothetical protein
MPFFTGSELCIFGGTLPHCSFMLLINLPVIKKNVPNSAAGEKPELPGAMPNIAFVCPLVEN